MKAYDIIKVITFSDQTQLAEEYGSINLPDSINPIHELVQGETLLSLSLRYYHNHSSWVNIFLANDLINPFEIEMGTKLIIPTD